ncbi:SDR family oxidoreductase, partial [Salmonella enterica subsp. enterica serovar Montevideo]|nr:SDR family oxidoreductase [Salmonella enterica subsp. enterica serovar Montevideo]
IQAYQPSPHLLDYAATKAAILNYSRGLAKQVAEKGIRVNIVAPGIAEALLATAIGLVAAIPAVVIYNIFARQIGSYKATLGD